MIKDEYLTQKSIHDCFGIFQSNIKTINCLYDLTGIGDNMHICQLHKDNIPNYPLIKLENKHLIETERYLNKSSHYKESALL